MTKVLLTSLTAYGITFCAGFLFRTMHWPGGDYLVLLNAVTALLAVAPVCAWQLILKKVTNQEGLWGIGTAIATTGISVGYFFKVQHYPGADIALIIGFICAIVFVIPMGYSIALKSAK